ncbi:ABC-three component system middle component 5 [Mesorhizobium sp. M0590]|uniref:ABC-three component system middle component 5 n=1 Tax=Mesorhizobium sp. M0590 TaxID=2956966 RepID=UPI00333CDE28
MLVYHPIFDIHHGLFRLCFILDHHPSKEIHIDALRILDFYFLFPYLLSSFDFTQGAGKQGRLLAGPRSKYNMTASPETLLNHLRGLNHLTLTALASKNILAPADLELGVARRTDVALPETIFDAAQERDIELASYLATKLGTIPLYGPKGLKARSHLLEYRYDPV